MAFGFDDATSVMCGCLFGSNGFFIAQNISGHVSYLSFTLLPWICYFCISPNISLIVAVSWIALLTSYIVYSGGYFVALLIPVSTVIVLCLALLIRDIGRDDILKNLIFVLTRSFLGSMIGFLVSCSKITAAYYYMLNFPRISGFAGLDDWSKTIKTLSAQLFLYGLYPYIPSGANSENDSCISLIALLGIFVFAKNLIVSQQKFLAQRSILKITLCGIALGLSLLPLFAINGNLYEIGVSPIFKIAKNAGAFNLYIDPAHFDHRC